MSGSLLTAAEVGALLGVPTSWVYEQSRRGTIPTVTLGRYRRYRREAIERWVAELESGERGRGHPAPRRDSDGHARQPRQLPREGSLAG